MDSDSKLMKKIATQYYVNMYTDLKFSKLFTMYKNNKIFTYNWRTLTISSTHDYFYVPVKFRLGANMNVRLYLDDFTKGRVYNIGGLSPT